MLSKLKLSDLLFERKDRAMNLMKMIELGVLPSVANPNEMRRIEDIHSEEFLYLLGRAAKTTSLEKYSGAFSTAMIDFGNGPVDCVIKVGIGEYEGDKAFDYLTYCKEKGGRSYCAAFPDVYYLGNVKTRDRDVDIAVLEFVNVLKNSQGSVLSSKINTLLAATYDRWGLDWNDAHQVAAELKTIESTANERQHLLAILGWTVQDLARFVMSLGVVGGSVDIKRDNLGLRSDNTVCVFDPLSQ